MPFLELRSISMREHVREFGADEDLRRRDGAAASSRRRPAAHRPHEVGWPAR